MSERPKFRHTLDTVARLAERTTGYRRPFVIRSHHFDSFKDVHKGPLTIQEKTHLMKVNIARFKRPGYAVDVLGETDSSADHFEASAQKFFEQFSELPDDHPVKIVNGQRDGICNGCARGSHCATQSHLLGDIEYLNDNILGAAKKLGILDQIKIKREFMKTTDKGIQRTLAAHTTAGVVRQILDLVAKPNETIRLLYGS